MVIGSLMYCFVLLDILINTIIAHVSNSGVSRITNAITLGPIVFNPISAISIFLTGTIFFLVGLLLKLKNH